MNTARDRIEVDHNQLRDARILKRRMGKSRLEEAMSSYLNDNQTAAFILSYICLSSPIVIHAEKLYKKKNKYKLTTFRNNIFKKHPESYNLTNSLSKCEFLNDDLKKKLRKNYSIKLKSGRIIHRNIKQIRNITLHPEDELHSDLEENFDYKSLNEDLILLAGQVLRAHAEFMEKESDKRNKKELNAIGTVLKFR